MEVDLDEQDDETDWEELESRLYSQIYHAAPEEDDDPVFLKTINMNTETMGNKKKYRYFEQAKAVPTRSHFPLPSYLSLENTTQKPDNYSISTIQKHVSAAQTESRSTSSIAPTHVHNNITVNQYSIPPLIIQSEAVSTEPLSFFAPWHANALKVIEKNKILDKKRKRKDKLLRRIDRRKNNLRLANFKTTQNSVTIFVDSDISDDECIVVEDESAKKPDTKICTGFPKKYDENNGGEKPEDDDEIIYIPPPPVEVINVDLEETEKVASEGDIDKLDDSSAIPQKDIVEELLIDRETQIPTGEEPKGFLGSPISTSNDFLDNISLHGSDCNKRDFVKPPNPIEYCETESSCSTNEQSRDFSNTVKTIVFDEVDFPREDIFSDNNLEDFGSFITPKRTTRNSKGSPSKETKETEPHSEKNFTSSDDSSSESDYEETTNVSMRRGTNKNLPNLSLMMPPDTPKKVPRKKKSASDFFSNDNPESKKMKSSQTTKKTPKAKRKLKKKKVSGNTKQSELADGIDSKLSAGENQVSSDKDKKKKKKKRQSEGDDNANETTFKEGKQKKRKSLKSDDLTQVASTPTPTEKTKKKKKKISTSNDQDAVAEDLLEKKFANSTTDTEENADSNPDQAVSSTNLNPTEIIPTEVEKPIITSTPEKINPELSKSPLPIPEFNISDLIVVDETLNKEAIVEILSESESEGCDFRTLDDVGDDMKLANCSTQHESLSDEKVVPIGGDNETTVPTLDYMNFDVDLIQKNQSDDPEKWQISHRDRSIYLNLDRARGPRCNRCRHFGHIGIRCPEKPNAPSCTLCGEPNHQEPRCPNKRCTQCGNQGDFSTSYCWKCFKFRHSYCKLCNMRGHIEYSCPDLWRRYHSTTGVGPIVTTQGSILAREQQWCSGCAGQGHLEHECDYYNREYPPTTPFIVRYDDNLAHSDNRRRLEGPSQFVAPNAQTPDFLAPNVRNPNFLAPNVRNPNFLAPNVREPEFSAPNVRTPEFLAPNVGLLTTPDLPLLRANPYAMPLLFLPHRVMQNTVEMDPRFVVTIPNPRASSRPNNFDFSHSHVVGDTEIDLTDGTKIKHLIMSAQSNVVHEFIVKELNELDNKVANCDLKMLRKKLFKYDRMVIDIKQTKEIREKRFWFRIFNMAIFGVRGMFDGKMNYNMLKNFLGQTENTTMYTWKRKALFDAYSYIFGYDKRKLNYYKVMQLMIQKQDEGKLQKFTQCR
ncbi:unnamed protein product [Phaedon cochleariae]|uniref:Zinc finger CCHC domain-containing protein 7 n=1 Tax=Phaedon cochleariae TaxID=80249 RepID=A0A9P0DYL5_PHACE|nr:unnamed protein product [Phaedon cochleariae]